MAIKEIGNINIGRPDNECKLKIGTGVGSQHLFLKNEYGTFFEDIDDFFFYKQDLINYLFDAKEEFFYPSEKYHFVRVTKRTDRKQGVTSPTISIPVKLEQYWYDLIQEVENIDDISYLGFVKGMDNDDAGRFYYHNDSTNSPYDILYLMCIPTKQARTLEKYRSIYKLVKILDTQTNKKYIHIIPIFNMTYSIEQLSSFLKRDYPVEVDKQKYFMFDFFFKYANLIKRQNYSIKEIVEEAGINITYLDELMVAVSSFSNNISDVKNVYQLFANSERVYDDGNIINRPFDKTFQQIFFGAPGTGKSHYIKCDEKVKEADKKNLVFRTTFHPDSDYSTFVGAYKPSMKDVPNQYKAVVGKDEEITYSFIPQAFLQAYVAAWNNLQENVFLVIEEINRGNCAQIFGDLFQLLDRDDDGYSEYPIKADKDLAKYLIKGKDEEGKEILTNKDGIKDGKLKLPKNLYIWATMNTSDQSLFPIDSAFKRRWDWVYTPIAQGKDENGNLIKWQIEGQGENSWWIFIQGINEVIDMTTHSEDKKLGFFFCKAQNNEVKKETFVNKVVFYLWNDVFKVYGFKSEIFDKKCKDDKTEKITFKSFYKEDGSVNEETMSIFVKNVMAKAPKEKANDKAPVATEEQNEEV